MQIDPDAMFFGDIKEETPEQLEKFKKLCEEGKIVARSHSKDALLKLQEDLRRQGYKQLK